jgi:hypothetical protein
MKWYPIIQTIIICVATINRVYGLFAKRYNPVLMWLQAIFDSSQGIFIIIVFLFIPENKNNIKVCCAKFLSKNKIMEIKNDPSFMEHSSSFTASHTSLYLHCEVSGFVD